MKGLLAASLVWVASGLGSWLDIPERVERWFFNPRERTEAALDAAEEGNADEAAEALDTAARLAPEEPLTRFNAGTGRLLAEQSGAVDELAAATELADPALRARAFYNLGNAHAAAQNPAEAVEAFKNSLRLDPSQQDAKHNLELALEALQEEQSGRNQDQETPDADQQGDQESSDSQGSEDPDQQQDPEGQDPNQPNQDQGQPQPEEGDRDRELQNFEDQPDMTAEQAAAILEAVENLEREQRQEKAAQALKARKKGDRDW